MKKRINKNHKKEDALHHAFVKILLEAPVRKVRFSGNRISLIFFGHRISDKIKIKNEERVAEWSRKRREIFIDKKISNADRKKSFRALCVHEVVEKFLVEKFGLKLDAEAHLIANKKEKEYLENLGGNWKSHEEIVYWDWHKHGEH